jgi:hypothetical protein
MSKAFVLDTYGKPLNPVHPGRARILLTQGKAAVYRRFPFTIVLKTEVQESHGEPLRVARSFSRQNSPTGGRQSKRRSLIAGAFVVGDVHATHGTASQDLTIGAPRKRTG